MRSVALGVWVDVGSRDERPAINGASHFLEHLLFKGTKKRTARQIAEAFDAVGGDLNAFTAKEYTCYYCRVGDQDLPMAVESMSDMLQNSVIDATDLEAERQVILEEINRQEDAPDDLIHDIFAEILWAGHSLGRPVLVLRETTERPEAVEAGTVRLNALDYQTAVAMFDQVDASGPDWGAAQLGRAE